MALRCAIRYFPAAALTAALVACAFSTACGGAAQTTSTSSSKNSTQQPTAPAPLAITTQSLPPAASGQGYAASLAATGGTGALTWKLTAGALPSGVNLSSTGALSGTPAAAGNFPITVQVSDSATPAQTSSVQLTLVSNSTALALTVPKLFPAFQGVAYVSGDDADASCCVGTPGGALVYINGGTGPYTCTVVSGSLPVGMTLAGEKPPIYPAGICLLTGTPTDAGDYPLTIEAQDASGNVAAADLTFVVKSSDLPQISNLGAVSVSPTSETVTWTTNVPASSLVCYAIGNAINTCTPETDLGGVTAHAVTLTGLVPNYAYDTFVESRGVVNGAPQDYLAAATDEGSDNFTTVGPAAGSQTALEAFGVGPQWVVQGHRLFVGISYATTVGTVGNAQFTITGLPPNTQVHWPDQQDNGFNQGTVSTTDTTDDTLTVYGLGGNGVVQFDLLTSQGGTTPAGSYTLTVNYSALNGASVVKGSFSWPVTVEAAATFTPAPPSAYPPIPDLAVWQAQMTNAGNIVPNESDWYNIEERGGTCDIVQNDEGIVYYDGAWVYDQIGMYTGDSAYWIDGGNASPCPSADGGKGPQGAAGALALYHQYLVSANYNIHGFWDFPHGLYYACTVQGSAQSCADLHGLANGSNGVLLAGDTDYFDPTNVREASYALGMRRLDYDAGGGTSTLAQVHQLVDYALGDVDCIVHGTAGMQQPFMDGLLAQALIEYYMDPKTGNQSDARIPLAIESLANYVWQKDWVPRNGQAGMFIYNVLDDAHGLQSDGGGSDMRALNLLIAPMYAWLYRETGNVFYQQVGDVIWDSGVTTYAGNGIGWSGKNFSQQYRWSFDYVMWRGGAGSFLTPW